MSLPLVYFPEAERAYVFALNAVQRNPVALHLVLAAVLLDRDVLAEAFYHLAHLSLKLFVLVMERQAAPTLSVHFACHTRLQSVRFVAGARTMGLLPGH